MKPHEYKQQDRVKHGTFGKGAVTGYWQGHVGYVVQFDEHEKHLFIEGADLTPLNEEAKPMARSASTYPLRPPGIGDRITIQDQPATVTKVKVTPASKSKSGFPEIAIEAETTPAQRAAKWADKFEEAAKEVGASPPPPGVDPRLDAYREQAKDLRKEVAKKQPKQPKKSKKELEADARRARLAAMLGDDEE